MEVWGGLFLDFDRRSLLAVLKENDRGILAAIHREDQWAGISCRAFLARAGLVLNVERTVVARDFFDLVLPELVAAFDDRDHQLRLKVLGVDVIKLLALERKQAENGTEWFVLGEGEIGGLPLQPGLVRLEMTAVEHELDLRALRLLLITRRGEPAHAHHTE